MDQEILMYCTDWCPDCHRARQFFERKGIAYREIDIDNTPGAEDEMKARNGGSGKIPTIFYGDRILIEPRSWELEEVFSEHANTSDR